MDDKELVEVWQNEFWNLVEQSPDSIKNSEYNMIRLEGYIMATRTQPSVVLPKGFLMDDPDGMGRGRYLMVESVERALNRAGIKYTIGE